MSYTHMIVPIDQIRPHPRNARTHSKKQIRQIAASIRAVGFAAPVLIDENKILIAGHGRLEAAKSLGMSSIPAIVISGLSDAKKRALLLADNRIALSAGWDREQLAIELAALPDLLSRMISTSRSQASNLPRSTHCMLTSRIGSDDPADEIDDSCLDGPAVTEFGDLWQLGKHRLLCGDARSSDDLSRLLDGKRAHMAFLDPPYNVAVGSVVGRGAVKHSEFAMASGEMSRDAVHRFSEGNAWRRSQSLDRWSRSLCLYGLAPCRGVGDREPQRLWGNAQSDRLGED